MGRAVHLIVALALAGACQPEPERRRTADPAPPTPAVAPRGASLGAPRLRATAARATFDATTRTLGLPDLAGVDVHDASGARVHTTTPGELAALHAEAVAARAEPQPISVAILATDPAGRGFASTHELEAIHVDAATGTTALVLRASPTLADLPATMTRPAIVMGTAPQPIACCGCDGACAASWALGVCPTCTAGAGADACCAACGVAASDDVACP